MHALIVADLEGIIDVYSLDDIKKCSSLYTEEIQVCIKTLLEYGVQKITVCDAHGEGNLINPNIEDHNVSDSKRIALVSRLDNVTFEHKYDFAIMLGYHGMEGSPGILPHTMRYDYKIISIYDPIKNIKVPIGEVEVDARWLGAHGIPVILITGDREAVYEANCFNSYRQVCCVKSYFQSAYIDRNHLKQKLINNIKCALNLKKELCISKDNNQILVEFQNLDLTCALGELGYRKLENSIVFNSCNDFVNSLYVLSNQVNSINRTIWSTNVSFIKQVRELVKPLSRKDVTESQIGPLLNYNLLFLDKVSREEILSGLQGIASKSS